MKGILESVSISSTNRLLAFALTAGILVNSFYFLYLSNTVFSGISSKVADSHETSLTPLFSDLISPENYREFVRPIDLDNSSAIFNSIYNALKQKNSDVHAVGVSFFPAVIPKGTLLYHAGMRTIPDSFEWVAFDPEFSLSFGSGRKARGRKGLEQRRRFRQKVYPDKSRKNNGTKQWAKRPFPENLSYMTFQTTRDLTRVVYLDGASATKDDSGELDTQKLWSNVASKQLGLPTDDFKDPLYERLYAERICEWGKPLGLEGFIRVELGFEMVVCDFYNGLNLIGNISLQSVDGYLGLPAPVPITKKDGWPVNDMDELLEAKLTPEQRIILDQEDKYENYSSKMSAGVIYDHSRISESHDNIEQRVQLDYRYMVTGINRTFLNPNPNNRRLAEGNELTSIHEEIVEQLRYALESGFNSAQSTNWQNLATNIVDKFSPMLLTVDIILNGQNTFSFREKAMNATLYFANFVRRFDDIASHLDIQHQKDFAVYQYTSPSTTLLTDSDYLIWSSFVNVVSEIVDTIYEVNDLLLPLVRSSLTIDHNMNSNEKNIQKAGELVKDLIKQLNWVSFAYQCPETCGVDEFCYTPFWGPSPFGWNTAKSKDSPHFGLTWDSEIDRYLVNEKLQCVGLDTIIQYGMK